jgi:hypothetical protein
MEEVPMRRLVLVLVLAGAGLLLFVPPASATCVIVPFEQVLHQSAAVWWATVIRADATKNHEYGYWQLTVQVEQVLKGPGPATLESPNGSVGTVYVSGCGPVLTSNEIEKEAPSFIGQTRLFMGDVTKNGGVVAFTDVLSPQGLSPQQQYQRGLDDLGLSPPQTAARQTTASKAWVWAVLLGASVSLVAISIVVVLRHRPTRA